jgi:hypothetical protein
MDAERPVTRLLQEWQKGDAQALAGSSSCGISAA